MSSRNPIPLRLREQFVQEMAAHDDDTLPDGAWWARLEEGAAAFMKKHHLNQSWHDQNSAAHQYIRLTNQ